MKRRNLSFLSLLLTITVFLIACKGEQGDIGPAGPTGATGSAGPAGSNGINGKDGNANVTPLNFGSKTHSNTDLLLSLPATITTSEIDKSFFYVYVKQTLKTTNGGTSAFWFSVPGEIGNGNEYAFYVSTGASNNGIYLRRVVNFASGNDTFDAVRVVIIPANNIINGRFNSLDFTNYVQVKKAFGLAD